MDENNWNHRTQFDGPEDPKVRGVSQAVNIRQAGPVSTPRPSEDDEDEEDDHPHYDGEKYADKWEAKFSHLPGVGPSDDTQ